MARHSISMSLPTGLVINSDVEFVITSDDAKLGELHLSRGTIDWRPTHSKKTEHALTWEKFAALIETNVPPKKTR
jgi:hypothetical protein